VGNRPWGTVLKVKSQKSKVKSQEESLSFSHSYKEIIEERSIWRFQRFLMITEPMS
jgi:hypothetical protein